MLKSRADLVDLQVPCSVHFFVVVVAVVCVP
eukprot:COSAG06_NODE_27809_length_586_cov_0.702259_1_plen_31_part_10